MKRGARWLGAILLVGGAVVILAASIRRVETPASPVAGKAAPVADGMTLTTLYDPVKVFQKAFWRRPVSEDLILHAERREWSTAADGVRQWRWFLAVKPGPALRDWLAGNPFFLTASRAPDDPAAPPSWFPKASEEFTIQQKAGGRLTLMWSADRQSLYATDCGNGFDAPSAGP
jgi:hypothetical protein